MNFEQAFEQMKAGFLLRRTSWPIGDFLAIRGGVMLLSKSGLLVGFTASPEDHSSSDWYVPYPEETSDAPLLFSESARFIWKEPNSEALMRNIVTALNFGFEKSGFCLTASFHCISNEVNNPDGQFGYFRITASSDKVVPAK